MYNVFSRNNLDVSPSVQMQLISFLFLARSRKSSRGVSKRRKHSTYLSFCRYFFLMDLQHPSWIDDNYITSPESAIVFNSMSECWHKVRVQ